MAIRMIDGLIVLLDVSSGSDHDHPAAPFDVFFASLGPASGQVRNQLGSSDCERD